MTRRRLRALAAGADRVSTRLLPWVVAVMVFLSALALAAMLAVHGSVAAWTGDMERKLTVQVTTGDSAARERQVSAAAAYLRALPGIAAVHILADREILDLLEPWLGAGNVDGDLPVPALIDVTIAEGATVHPAAIAARLKTVAPDATLDDHEQWLGRVRDLAVMIEGVALAVLALVTLATVAIVVFGAHAGLAAHRATIETLHIIGAHDKMIAREFQDRFLKLGLKGGIIGLALAAASIVIARHIIGELGVGVLGPLTISMKEFVALLTLPLFAAFITMLTARFTVLAALRRMV